MTFNSEKFATRHRVQNYDDAKNVFVKSIIITVLTSIKYININFKSGKQHIFWNHAYTFFSQLVSSFEECFNQYFAP